MTTTYDDLRGYRGYFRHLTRMRAPVRMCVSARRMYRYPYSGGGEITRITPLTPQPHRQEAIHEHRHA